MSRRHRKLPQITATDGELLMRFRQHRDGDAFAELVQRHGPLVWSVCYQVLGKYHDVQDAFQATFLILGQRAHSLHRASSLAAWLHKVAYRTAMRTRRQRRHKRETQAIEEPQTSGDVLVQISLQELRQVLHEELARMPEQYQAPLVLCYLQGKSRAEAAEELECTDASVKARLVRGRRMLRSRLARRGFALSAAVAATGWAVAEASHQLSPMLIQRTVEAAVSVGKGAAHCSTFVEALANEGVRTMFVSKAVRTAAILLGVALLGVVGIAALEKDGASGAPRTAHRRQIVNTGSIEAGSVEHNLLAVALPAAQTNTSVRRDESNSTPAEEEADPKIAPDTFRATSPRSELHLELAFLQNQAKVLQAKAQAKELEAKALQVKEEDRAILLRRVRVLDTEADAMLLRAEANRVAGRAELIAQSLAARQTGEPMTISPGDVVQILATGTLPNEAISGAFWVEPTGKVPLGPSYGRAEIAGMTVEQAETAIQRHLIDNVELVSPKVQVTLLQASGAARSVRVPDSGLPSDQQPGATRSPYLPLRTSSNDD